MKDTKHNKTKRRLGMKNFFFFRFDEKGVESSIIGEFDGELKMYHAMGTGSVPLSLHFCDEFVVFPAMRNEEFSEAKT